MSRVLAKVLRHEPELIGITLDAKGYASVDLLIQQLNTAACAPNAAKRLRTLPLMTLGLLCEVVASNDKKRYVFSGDGKSIRAAQGHSIDVELGYEALEPPELLYHGTSIRKLGDIGRAGGLLPVTRHAVHLSDSYQTAFRVGERHGSPVVLQVSAKKMHDEGFQFSLSDNGIWLTPSVPQRYCQLLGARFNKGLK